jgi:site-specific DNA recombinase
MGEYPDTPEGNLQKHLKASIAEYQREDIKIKTTRGRRNVVKGGRVMLHGNKPPYGYRAVMEKRNDKDIVTSLKIYEPEARIIRLIFQWYTGGDEDGERLSMNKIACRLTDMQVPTWGDIHGLVPKQNPRNRWIPCTVSRILHNETYAGKWHYGQRSGSVTNPSDTWIQVPAPAIIDEATWKAAQDASKDNLTSWFGIGW